MIVVESLFESVCELLFESAFDGTSTVGSGCCGSGSLLDGPGVKSVFMSLEDSVTPVVVVYGLSPISHK